MSVEEVLRIAAGEVGYVARFDPQPGSRYGRWCAGQLGQPYLAGNGVPYCNMFVSWVFAQAGQGAAVGGAWSYTVAHLGWFRARNLIVRRDMARPGDVVFFKWAGISRDLVDHVGIVEKNLGGGVLQCIEGNTSAGLAGSQNNGGSVARRVRSRGVAFVCRPQWVANVEKKKVSDMAIVLVNNVHYATDGITRRQLNSMDTVNAIVASTGIRVVQAGQGFLDDVPEWKAPGPGAWGYKNPSLDSRDMRQIVADIAAKVGA